MLREVRSTRILSSLFYVGLDALGIPRAARLSRRAGTIMCYHNVMPEGAAVRPECGRDGHTASLVGRSGGSVEDDSSSRCPSSGVYTVFGFVVRAS